MQDAQLITVSEPSKYIVVNIENNSFQIASSRSRNNNTLSASSNMSHCFFSIGKETGTFQNYIYIMLSPWNFSRISLCVNFNFMTIYSNGILRMTYLLIKTTLSSIIF